jgi:hypothetical protein
MMDDESCQIRLARTIAAFNQIQRYQHSLCIRINL